MMSAFTPLRDLRKVLSWESTTGGCGYLSPLYGYNNGYINGVTTCRTIFREYNNKHSTNQIINFVICVVSRHDTSLRLKTTE